MVRRVPVPASGRKILKGVHTAKADQNIGAYVLGARAASCYCSVVVTGRTSASSLAYSVRNNKHCPLRID